MNKLFALTLLAIALMTMPESSWAQTTQPTPSMQEQYDKLHGNTPKKTTTTTKPSKSKTTTKPQTTQKPAKVTPAPAPKPQVAEKPKVVFPSDDKGGFKIKVGLRGGANYVNVASDQLSASNVNIDPILGYHGGLILNFGGKTFSVQPEILYSQIGFKVSATQVGSLLVSESKVNTIAVPVLLKLSFGGDKLKFFVNGGGYGSYALNGTQKSTFSGTTTSSPIEFEKGDARLEYGAVGGVGVALGLGRAQLLIEGRYYYGLGNNGDIPKENKVMSRNIQGSVGILIPLGGN